jgi:hypothetical protein
LTELTFRLFSRIDIFLIIAKCNCTKNKSKHNTHKTHIQKLSYIQSNSSENVTNFRVVAENVHNVDEIQGRIEKCTNERYSNIEGNSPELSTVVKRLGSLTSL